MYVSVQGMCSSRSIILAKKERTADMIAAEVRRVNSCSSSSTMGSEDCRTSVNFDTIKQNLKLLQVEVVAWPDGQTLLAQSVALQHTPSFQLSTPRG